MSENWNEKHLHNRLDSIFSDLDDPNYLPGLSIFNQQTGWIWEIDKQGIFTNCGSDVEPLLGYEAKTLLGQALSKISDFELDSADLPTDPNTPSPKIIQVTFFRVDGSKEEALCHIFPQHQNGDFLGWRGMTVVDGAEPSVLTVPIEDDEVLEGDFPLPLPDLFTPELPGAIGRTLPSSNGDAAAEEIEETEAPEEEVKISYEEIYVSAAYQPSDEIRHFLEKIDSDPEREWNQDELQLVEQVHNQLELAMENANLFQQTQIALAETDEQARRLRLLNELSEKLSQATHMQEIYENSADAAINIFGGTSSNIVVREENYLHVRAASGKNVEVSTGDNFLLDDAPQYRLVEEQRIVVTPEVSNSGLPEIRSMIAGAIVSQGKVIGAINIGSDQPNQFEIQDSAFMTQLLSIVNASIENRNLLDRIQAALAYT